MFDTLADGITVGAADGREDGVVGRALGKMVGTDEGIFVGNLEG